MSILHQISLRQLSFLDSWKRYDLLRQVDIKKYLMMTNNISLLRQCLLCTLLPLLKSRIEFTILYRGSVVGFCGIKKIQNGSGELTIFIKKSYRGIDGESSSLKIRMRRV